VAEIVMQTCRDLQNALRQLAPKNEQGGGAAQGAAITHWSMGVLSTGSYVVWIDNKTDVTGSTGERRQERFYTANALFDIKFADFARLGGMCSELASTPHVAIRNIEWRLTDKTKADLVKRSRTLAVEDAFVKARDFAAAALGKEPVVRALEIEENGAGGYMTFGGGGFGAQTRTHAAPWGASREVRDDALSFEPEQVEVGCLLNVSFEAE